MAVDEKLDAQLLTSLGVPNFESAMLIGQYPGRAQTPSKPFYRIAECAAELAVEADRPVLVGDLSATTDWQAELGLLVSRLCPLVVWLAPDDANLSPSALLALAFTRIGQIDDRSLYRYELDSYNPRREWNNADHWAHPGNYR